MLALTRKAGERIVIGDNIVITIVDIKGDNIRIGIDAPRDVKIYRGEIYDSIVMENQQAAAPAKAEIIDVLKELKVKG